jgi:hypothetical protein
MSVRLAICCAGLIAGASSVVTALPIWQGLEVSVEDLPSGTRVNGVAIATTRIVGRDVPALAARLERLWATEPGSVMARWTVVGPWRVLSRARGSLSEVLQLPDRFGAEEALLSQIDVSSRPIAAPSPAIRLPQVCEVVNTVHTTSVSEVSLQLVASCRASARTVAAQLRNAALAAHLHELGSPSTNFVQWQADGLQVSAVISVGLPGSVTESSTLVLQQQRAR